MELLIVAWCLGFAAWVIESPTTKRLREWSSGRTSIVAVPRRWLRAIRSAVQTYHQRLIDRAWEGDSERKFWG